MSDHLKPQVAIVDYGRGNLFSVEQACRHVGMRAVTTASRSEIQAADAVILPGVGAFGDAMETLAKLDLVEPLRDVAASGKPFLCICLGMQLLMSESYEFGKHRGMGIIEGEVVPLRVSQEGSRAVKVPQVGWNQIYMVPPTNAEQGVDRRNGVWKSPLLNDVLDGEYMYFVHSYYTEPADSDVVVSITQYGPLEFSSSVRLDNVFGCQYHPERSGPQGLGVYRNLVTLSADSKRD